MGVARPEIDEMFLAVLASEATGFLQLAGVLLDADRAAFSSRGARQGTAELAQAAADVEDVLPAKRPDFPQRGFVDESIQGREALLLLGGGAVDVGGLF